VFSAAVSSCTIGKDSRPLFLPFELRLLPSTGVIRLQRYYEPLRHPIRPGLSLAGVRLEGAPLRHIGLPVLRSVPMCLHAVAITPADLLGPSLVPPSNSGLPPNSAGSASASPFSRPAQRSLALRPACSPSRQWRPSTPEASSSSLPPPTLRLLPAGAIVAGRDSHPLGTCTFSRRTE